MNDTVRFIHTADLHLDSPLKSLAARNDALADIISQASRSVLRTLVDRSIDLQIDALLIAGDLFDGDQRDVKTAMVLQREMRRLQKAGIPVFIIKGNHDAQAQLLGVLDFPDNVYVFDGKGGKNGRRYFAEERAMVHGVSFANRKAPNSLLPKFGKPEPNCFNIGMLHTSLTGADGHNNYAPCTVHELVDMGYDYWALGHIHKRTVHHKQPAVVMPGNPLGRHINEDGERSVSLVTLEQGQTPLIETINVAPVQFERIVISLEGFDDPRSAHEFIVDRINQRRDELDVQHLIFRVQLQGSSDLAFRYHRDEQSMLTQLRTEYELNDDTWIDSLDLSDLTESTAAEDAQSPAQSEVNNELRTIVDTELLNTVNLREAAQDDLLKLTKALPPELKDLFGSDTQSRDFILQKLLQDGSQWLLQQIDKSDNASLMDDDNSSHQP